MSSSLCLSYKQLLTDISAFYRSLALPEGGAHAGSGSANLRTFTQEQLDEDEVAASLITTTSLNTQEQEILRQAISAKPGANPNKRKRGPKKSVSFAEDDPRIALSDAELRAAREDYFERMTALRAAVEEKEAEKRAQAEANAYVSGVPPMCESSRL